MSANPRSNVDLHRPGFAIVLGLLPPYTVEDVKRAYRDKVKDAHPDRGGDRDDFDRIQKAFEEAGAYSEVPLRSPRVDRRANGRICISRQTDREAAIARRPNRLDDARLGAAIVR